LHIPPGDEKWKLFQFVGHDPEKWDEFKLRYCGKLETHQDLVNELLVRCEPGPVTLIFCARDENHNNAVALKEYL